jgi:hypothetical protein
MKIKVFSIAFISLCLTSSVTFAISPIGQPAASLRDRWYGLGVEYSHTEIDLKAENVEGNTYLKEGTIEDVKIDLALAKAGFCINNNWEVFAGLGAAKADFCDKRTLPFGDSPALETDKFDLDGDVSFAALIGTKATFYEKALLKAGVSCQLSWLSLNGTVTKDLYRNNEFLNTGKADIDTDLFILQVAPGISYQLFFGFSVYGGPLYQLIRGNIDADGKSGLLIKTSGSADIKEDSSFGGWAGLHADLDIFTSIDVEYQLTGSSNTIGVSLVSKF